MIFSHKAAIIELFGSRTPLCFFVLAKQLGFYYDFLKCEPQGEDLIVDCDKLQEAIARVVPE